MKNQKIYTVYILTNRPKGTLYIGVTSDLRKRVYEHKNNYVEGFSSKYKTYKLVYYECSDSVEAAIAREKQLKNWHRKWKINLVESVNREWKDLSNQI